jgi:hypothetical protein
MQTSYDAEAYGSYAQYADAGAVAGTGVAAGGYQDAQREYQGQQGYDQNQQVYYDQSGHVAGYDQAQQGYFDQTQYPTQYGYAQQPAYDQAQYPQAHYDQTQQQYQQPAQEGYQSPHPYATAAGSAKTDAAYGGM